MRGLENHYFEFCDNKIKYKALQYQDITLSTVSPCKYIVDTQDTI